MIVKTMRFGLKRKCALFVTKKEWLSRGFDKWANQYIAENERVDHKSNDDTESINNLREALIIDIEYSSPSLLDQENLNTDTFITSFEIINSA